MKKTKSYPKRQPKNMYFKNRSLSSTSLTLPSPHGKIVLLLGQMAKLL